MLSRFHSSMIIVLTIFSLLSCTSGKKSDAMTENVITVGVENVHSADISREVSASGNIEGRKTVKLGFMVAGKINRITAEAGDPVRAGQMLASLDPESYQIAKDMADANLDQTQDEYDRLNSLHQRNSLSESDFSKVNTALKVAKAQQKLQAKNLSETNLYSPIGGILLVKGSEVGEIIGAGMPFFVVSDIQSVKVNVAVPETELRNIRIGNIVKVYVASIDSTLWGKVTEIGSLAEATTRTFTVKTELKNAKRHIRPGMTAEVSIATNTKRSALVVPANALLHDTDQSAYVYVADRSKNKAFKRKVTLGQIVGDSIEILTGLNTGDEIVSKGQFKLSNGSSIHIK